LTPYNKVNAILNTFNNIHKRLQFTVELEKNRSINFLNLSLIIKNDELIGWYKKETNSGRYLSYYSGHPSYHKVGTISGLVDRVIFLSHPNFQEKNLKHVIRVLIDNAYPLELIFNRINLRIKELIKRNHTKNKNQILIVKIKKF